MWPPPPIQVSAAPQAAQAVPVDMEAAKPAKMSRGAKVGMISAGLIILLLAFAFAPPPLPQHFLVLMLSIVVGFYVIGKVHHALHTPLMSVTNAISGIVIVGAIAQLGSADPVVQVLAAIAVLLASINIFGGFAVTRRMLAMFSKGAGK
jgi:NAD(P) transhydrogenase subunit alpha